MQGEFEKNIEQQLNTFKLNPNEMVWKEVEAALHKKKRKALPFWWFSAAVVLFCLVGGTVFLEYKILTVKKDEKDTAIPLINNVEPALKNFAIITQKEKNTITDIGKIKSKETSINKTVEPMLKYKLKTFKENISLTKLSKKLEAQKVIANLINKNSNPKKENKIVLGNDEKNTRIIDVEIAKNAAIDKPDFEKLLLGKIPDKAIVSHATDSMKTNKIALQKDNILNNATTTKAIKTTTRKKHNWYLTAGAGIAKITKNPFNIFNGEEKALAAAYSVNPLISASGNIAANNTLTAKNGFNFSVGINRETTINKQWSYQMGVHYQYLQNSQSLSKDTTALLLDRGNRLINLYAGGTTVNIANYAHWLQIPVLLNCTINPKAKNKFTVFAGGSIAFAFAKDWLLADKTSNTYYNNKQQNNSILFAVQSGISYQNKEHFKLALLLHQSITPIHSTADDKLYFTQYSFNLSYPITQKIKNK